MVLGVALCAIAAGAGIQQAAARGVLGVAATDMPPDIGVRGAWVHQVAPGSAATASGLQPNDVIVAVDGRAIDTAASLTADVAGHDAGDRLTLSVLRPSGNGIQQLTLTASLTAPLNDASAPIARTDQVTPGDDRSIAPAAATTGQWTRFSDPNEQAFTADVPAGWHVEGGLVRHNPTDPSVLIRMVSPDRRTYLMIGDPGLTLYTTPVRSMFPGGGNPGPATRPYLPGAAFARNYVEQSIPSVCANPVLTGQKERPDLAQGRWARINPQARHDGGEATFTCRMSGEPAQGIVTAATYIYQMPGNYGGNLWTADFLAGVVAPADRYEDGIAMVRHVVASLHIDPAWAQHQQQLTAQAARNIDIATQRAMAAAQALNRITQQNIAAGDRAIADQQQRMHASDQQEESFDRTITGMSPYADSNGIVHDMSNIPSGHWINSGGATATTNGVNPPPGMGWEPMHEVPPQ
jgi:hypothetical protein